MPAPGRPARRSSKTTLVETPLLPLEITSVSAAPTADAAIDYPIGLTYTLADNKRQLSGAHLYERGGEIVIVTDFERLGGGLLARSRDGPALLTVPPGSLKPGTYRVTACRREHVAVLEPPGPLTCPGARLRGPLTCGVRSPENAISQ